ncbi:Polysaccharide pyruvyl transferase [Lutibacter oricola]|uniref:Polysaccharide pyruvyl transferase n=1 Tax=Lutibacter oricola TaxID=762486 RepID=A0A1H2X193_9FLAO|nr:polysaccharide pyruvyl transferase family protein [Lutibacter oricola]SDW86264.1 Polysaccharide pyruvyl transferase [Lutibacter oricola]
MIRKTNIINLFWWSSKHFENKSQENFGDAVGPYLIKKITGKNVRFIHPKKRKWNQKISKVLVTAGSILGQIDKNCIVWGSGLIIKDTKVPKATFLAVRGPLTRKHLLKQGCTVPEVYGDPAILLPQFYQPKTRKKYKIGIIPHYVDYDVVHNWYKNEKDILVINLLNDDIEAIIEQIVSCEKTVSSSLHGIIVSHAYHIPSCWVKFSENIFGDDIKYYDYFESVNIFNVKCYSLKKMNTTLGLLSYEFNTCDTSKIDEICNGLQIALLTLKFI